jgi:hypothetical protein
MNNLKVPCQNYSTVPGWAEVHEKKVFKLNQSEKVQNFPHRREVVSLSGKRIETAIGVIQNSECRTPNVEF